MRRIHLSLLIVIEGAFGRSGVTAAAGFLRAILRYKWGHKPALACFDENEDSAHAAGGLARSRLSQCCLTGQQANWGKFSLSQYCLTERQSRQQLSNHLARQRRRLHG